MNNVSQIEKKQIIEHIEKYSHTIYTMRINILMNQFCKVHRFNYKYHRPYNCFLKHLHTYTKTLMCKYVYIYAYNSPQFKYTLI